MRYGLVLMGLCAVAGVAMADDDLTITHDSGYDFVMIGDPGNRDTNKFEVPLSPEERIGSVAYTYRIAVTEVTVAQYLEFVEAYYPIYVKRTGSLIGDNHFTGRAIRASFYEIHILPGFEPQEPMDMGWEYAARYVNWLHNGKINEEWAFERGVYDTSTFVRDEQGRWQHQRAHAPDARYWIPTANEWLKAAYWAPDKNDGEGGYWRYPNRSDTDSRPGFPGEGGERNAGEDEVFPLPVGSYPDVMSPWGVLDMAGGQSEWFETVPGSGDPHLRGAGSSDFYFTRYNDILSPDIIGYYINRPVGGNVGLRLASTTIPPADLNADERVNFFDVAEFIRRFIVGDERADLDDSGGFDEIDIRIFVALLG